MTSQVAAILEFLSFQILFNLESLHMEITRKQYLVIEIYKIVRIYCKIVSIFTMFLGSFYQKIAISMSVHRLHNFIISDVT